jgi:hypothetical protein
MNPSVRSRSWIGQVLLFFFLSLLFSAIPFAIGLLSDKSSLVLGVFHAWYAAFPPVILLLLGWLLYRHEPTPTRIAGRIWIGVGIWFGVQALLSALSGLHLLVLALTLPSMLVGGKSFLLGTILFIIGGIILVLVPDQKPIRSEETRPIWFSLSTALLLAIVFAGFPLFIFFTSRPTKAIPETSVALPSESEIFGYVKQVYDLGIRRPGWKAAAQAKDLVAENLNDFGFEEVHIDAYPFDLWRENTWSLTIDPEGEAWQPETYFVPYSGPTPPEGIEAQIIDLGEGEEADFAAADVSGKILLVDLPPTNISWAQMKLFAYMAYDPDKTVPDWEHPYPIGWLEDVRRIHELAEEDGAVGIIGVLQGYPEMGEFGYYAPYDGTLRPVPGLYVLDEDGDHLRQMVESGQVTARLILDANISKDNGTAWTVYGVLPGRDDQIIMVHTHYDAPWRSGIEDSSGVGMVSGLARYFASLSAEQRAHKMIFIFTGAHMIGAPGNHVFMEEHAEDIMGNLLVDICIEHIADDYNPPDPPSGMVEPRGNFLTENPLLVSHFAGVVRDYNAYRTLLFPTGTPLSVPTDAGMFALSGYPVSSLISGPVWLFDDDDTLERVAKDQLAPLSAMYADYIFRIGRIPAPLLRFELNTWTIILTGLLLTPLATVSAYHWQQKEVAL